jgi:hypothetical protein
MCHLEPSGELSLPYEVPTPLSLGAPVCRSERLATPCSASFWRVVTCGRGRHDSRPLTRRCGPGVRQVRDVDACSRHEISAVRSRCQRALVPVCDRLLNGSSIHVQSQRMQQSRAKARVRNGEERR